MGQYLEKLYWPDNADPAVVLKVQKRHITAHDVVGVGSNCCLQEFVVIGVAANRPSKRDGLDHLRVKLDNFKNLAEYGEGMLLGHFVQHPTVFV